MTLLQSCLSASAEESCAALEVAGIGKQEMALLLVADNPLQLRPSPQGFEGSQPSGAACALLPPSRPFTNQQLTKTTCTSFLCFCG